MDPRDDAPRPGSGKLTLECGAQQGMLAVRQLTIDIRRAVPPANMVQPASQPFQPQADEFKVGREHIGIKAEFGQGIEFILRCSKIRAPCQSTRFRH